MAEEYMPGHHVEWSIEPGHVSGGFTCTAPVGGQCRLTCAEACGSETYPCSSWDDEKDEDREHELVDSGSCNVVLFLEQDSCQEAFEGEPCALVAGPIEVRWRDDTYWWRYPGQSYPCWCLDYRQRPKPACERCDGTGRRIDPTIPKVTALA
jgi:hypothetical protein